MIKRTAVALCATAIACTLFAGCEQNQANVADLSTFESKQAFTAYLDKPDANTLIFVEAKNCQNCAAVETMLKQAAATRTDVKFYKVDATWTTVRGTDPLIAFVAPGVGLTAMGNPESLTTARQMNQFLTARTESAKALLSLKQAMEAAEAKINEAQKPFEARIEATKAKMMESTKTPLASITALREQLAKEGKPFDDEIAAVEARKQAALAATQAKLDAARTALSETRAPFRAEIKTIETEQEAGTADLVKIYLAAEKAFNAALKKDGLALKKD